MVFNPGSTKRQKELARREKQRAKEERRDQRQKDRDERAKAPRAPGEDPDIAGIIPGPQPLPEDG